MGQKHELRAVSTSGAVQKLKQFRYCLKLAEGQYSRHLLTMVFLSLRLGCYQLQGIRLGTIPTPTDVINKYVSALVAFIRGMSEWKNRTDEKVDMQPNFYQVIKI